MVEVKETPSGEGRGGGGGGGGSGGAKAEGPLQPDPTRPSLPRPADSPQSVRQHARLKTLVLRQLHVVARPRQPRWCLLVDARHHARRHRRVRARRRTLPPQAGPAARADGAGRLGHRSVRRRREAAASWLVRRQERRGRRPRRRRAEGEREEQCALAHRPPELRTISAHCVAGGLWDGGGPGYGVRRALRP